MVKRFRILAALLATATLVLAACGGGSAPPAKTSSPQAPAAPAKPAPAPAPAAPAKPAPAPAPAAPPQKIKVILAVDIVQFSQIHLARLKGFYKDENLDVTTIASQGGAIALSALGGESVDFGALGPIPVLQANAGGVPIHAVQMLEVGIGLNMPLRKQTAQAKGLTENMPLDQKVQGLKGLKVGITRPGSLSDAFLRFLLRKNGVNERDVQIVAVGGAAAMLAGLEQGQIDTFLLGDPAPAQAVQKGFAINFISEARGDYKPILPDIITEVIGVHGDYAKKNPDVVKRFVRATLKGQQYLLDKPADATRDLQAYFKDTEPAVLKASVDNLIPTIKRDGKMTKELWANTLKVLEESGQLKDKGPAIDEGGFWTNSFIP